MTVSQQLNQRMVDLSFVVLGGVAVWYITQQLSKKVDRIIDGGTKSTAHLISDLTAYMNGWEGVELAPLMIRDFYLNPDYTLTADAEKVLWDVNQYVPLLVEIFGHPNGVMKEKYRPLINQPIGK